MTKPIARDPMYRKQGFDADNIELACVATSPIDCRTGILRCTRTSNELRELNG